MARGVIVGVVGTLVALFLITFVALKAGLVPANADAKPSRLERWMASVSLHATLAREAPRIANPVALTDANLIAGVKLYGQNCAVCHGAADGSAPALRAGSINGRRSLPKTALKTIRKA